MIHEVHETDVGPAVILQDTQGNIAFPHKSE